MIKRLLRLALPVAIIALAIIGFKLLKIDQGEATPEIPVARQWLVEAMTIQKQPLTPTVDLFGKVVTPSSSVLSSVIEAEIIEVNVLPGQSVSRGDVLVRLNSEVIDTQMRSSQADIDRIVASIDRENQRLLTDTEILVHEQRLLELSDNSLQRYETLKSRNVISQAEFDTLERAVQQAQLAVTARQAAIREYATRVAMLDAELKRAQAALDKVSIDLKQSTIIAPFDGRVTAVHAAVGSRARNGSALVEIYDQTRTEVLALIPNRYVEQVRSTVEIHGSLAATAQLDGAALMLTLDRLSSMVDPGRGGIDAYFGFVSDMHYPELGRTVNLNLALSPIDNTFSLPYQSVYGSNYIFKIESDRLKRIRIERLGQIVEDSQVRIVAASDELVNGDLVLITQLSNASDGLSVKVSTSP